MKGLRHVVVAANGLQFFVLVGDRIDAARPLVLLVHGFLQDSYAWRRLIPLLDEAGFAVAAPDLRGCGGSDKPPRGYDPQTTAADLAGVIRSLGFAEAILVGHDWGGLATWATLAYAPEQVLALASLAGMDPRRRPYGIDAGYLAYAQLPILPERRILARGGRFVEQALRARGADPGYLSADEARHYREALQWWPSPHCALEYQRMFARHRWTGSGGELRRRIAAAADRPTVSIVGDLDTLHPPGRRVSGEIRLPGVGHQPHEEAPEATAAALLDWLDSAGYPSR